MKLLIGLLAAAQALSPQPSKTDATRRVFNNGALATFAAPFIAAAPPAGAVVYLDPARYGDQELKNAAIAKCRTRVRDAIVKDPSIAPSFFLLAILDGLSYNEKTRRGGPDGTVAASIQLPGAAYGELRDAVDVLQESQKALKRTNSLTLADLIALSGAEAIAAVGGPEISVQLGRTDNPNLNEMIKAVSKGGLKEAQAMGIAPAFDVGEPDAADISGAFKKAGFTDREATALLGTLATLQSDDVVNAAPVEKEDRGASKTRGKMGRVAAGGKAKSTNVAVDVFGTNEGTEDASIDRMEGDVDDFYIADAFGSRKEAYGRRVGSSASSEANFNAVFQKLEKADKVGKKPSSAVEAALLANSNTKIWVQKYSAERLTYLKDLDKTLYRVTCTGAQYTGGKYAALLDNKGPTKLD